MSQRSKTVDGRAVRIAARVMAETGLCLYETRLMCDKFLSASNDCANCIKCWLLAKARKELKEEAE